MNSINKKINPDFYENKKRKKRNKIIKVIVCEIILIIFSAGFTYLMLKGCHI